MSQEYCNRMVACQTVDMMLFVSLQHAYRSKEVWEI